MWIPRKVWGALENLNKNLSPSHIDLGVRKFYIWLLFSFGRLKKFTTSLKMTCWLKMSWYLTHMLKCLFGLASLWNPKRSKVLLKLARYCSSCLCYSQKFTFCCVLCWLLKFLAEIHRCGCISWGIVSIRATIQSHGRKWTLLLHFVLFMGSCKSYCMCYNLTLFFLYNCHVLISL